MVRRLRSKRLDTGLVMEDLYHYLGTSRQALSQSALRMDTEEAMMKAIESEVRQYRSDKDCRAGSRSLYYNLNIKANYGIGVTKFEQLMSRYGLSLLPLRVRVVTTQSDKQSWNYPNLINGLTINGINQVVVGDLTYVYIGGKLFYVFLLTDLYSARLVGFAVSNRMRAEDALVALQGWKNLRGIENLIGCIHHTDGGTQYFSILYLDALTQIEGCRVSVAKSCQENGYAEQMNGLLKNHFIPLAQTQNLEILRRELEQIVYFYNHERKQERLGWRTPVAFENYIESLPLTQRPSLVLHDFS